jgi:hypothetical protein
MSNDDRKFDDLDLERIALAAIEESLEESSGKSHDVEVSTTLPQQNMNIESNASTKERLATTDKKKKLPSNWASMDAVARLRGATDQLVKEHLEKEGRKPAALKVETRVPDKPMFALEKKEHVPQSALRKIPSVATEKREVTRIAKVALSCTAEAALHKGDEHAAVGRRFSRQGGTEKTVVFKASQTAGFVHQQRSRAVKIEGGGAAVVHALGQVKNETQKVTQADIEEYRDITEKGEALNAVPLTDSLDVSHVEEMIDLGLSQSRPVLLGSVVIEAPSSAEVFVNGHTQGLGRVVLNGLDRYIPFWVRVHLPEHDPWSAKISLKGQKAAKVQPDLY